MLSRMMKKGVQYVEKAEQKVEQKSKEVYNRSATLQGLKEDAGRLKEAARDKYGGLRKAKDGKRREAIKEELKKKHPNLTDDELDTIIKAVEIEKQNK